MSVPLSRNLPAMHHADHNTDQARFLPDAGDFFVHNATPPAQALRNVGTAVPARTVRPQTRAGGPRVPLSRTQHFTTFETQMRVLHQTGIANLAVMAHAFAAMPTGEQYFSMRFLAADLTAPDATVLVEDLIGNLPEDRRLTAFRGLLDCEHQQPALFETAATLLHLLPPADMMVASARLQTELNHFAVIQAGLAAPANGRHATDAELQGQVPLIGELHPDDRFSVALDLLDRAAASGRRDRPVQLANQMTRDRTGLSDLQRAGVFEYAYRLRDRRAMDGAPG